MIILFASFCSCPIVLFFFVSLLLKSYEGWLTSQAIQIVERREQVSYCMQKLYGYSVPSLAKHSNSFLSLFLSLSLLLLFLSLLFSISCSYIASTFSHHFSLFQLRAGSVPCACMCVSTNVGFLTWRLYPHYVALFRVALPSDHTHILVKLR